MKLKTFYSIAMALPLVFVMTLVGCKDDEGGTPLKELTVVSITAGDVALVANSSAADVAADAAIAVEFSQNLEIESISDDAVSLKSEGNTISLDVTAIGNKLTITPSSDMLTGRTYTLTLTDGIKSFQGVSLENVAYEFVIEGEIFISPLSLTKVTVAGKELSSSSTTKNVSPEDAIILTFGSSLSLATITSTNLVLKDGESNTIATEIAVNGQDVTITPSAGLSEVTTFTLAVSDAIESSEGGAFTGTSFEFETGTYSITPPQSESQEAYFRFNGSTADLADGNETVVEQFTYVTDRFGVEGAATSFNGAGDVFEIAGSASLLSSDWTMSVWVNVNAADMTTTRYFSGVGVENGYYIELYKDFASLGWTTSNDLEGSPSTQWGSAIALDPVPDAVWIHLVFTMGSDGMRRIYLNGALLNEADLGTGGMLFNDAIEGINNNIAFGYICGTQSTGTSWALYENDKELYTFKGLLDDVRIFSAVLSGEEVSTLYDAEKP